MENQNIFSKKIYLIFILILLIHFKFTTSEFSCETPDEWQEDFNEGSSSEHSSSHYFEHDEDVQHLNLNTGVRIWEQGHVPYHLNHSLSTKDIQEVHQAIQEYHTKTCVRFEPRQHSDRYYVNIELNDAICGLANVGKLYAYQFAQFGGDCRLKSTIVHELGHTLGLSHEHQRRDRSDYLRWKNTCPMDKVDRVFKYSGAFGLYDYQSIMHYQCRSCRVGWASTGQQTKCGRDFSNGLSVLDADHINSMYNCKGCFRHRWIPANLLSATDIKNLHDFGYQTSDGHSLYPCRALYDGQVVVGHAMFDQTGVWCIVGYSERVFPIQHNIEILTIPSSRGEQCSYKLKNSRFASVTEAIPAAALNTDAQRRVYIAYGYGIGGNGVGEYSIGGVSAVTSFNGASALFPVENMEYNVLTCSCSSHTGDNTGPPITPSVPTPTRTTKPPLKCVERRVTYGQKTPPRIVDCGHSKESRYQEEELHNDSEEDDLSPTYEELDNSQSFVVPEIMESYEGASEQDWFDATNLMPQSAEFMGPYKGQIDNEELVEPIFDSEMNQPADEYDTSAYFPSQETFNDIQTVEQVNDQNWLEQNPTEQWETDSYNEEALIDYQKSFSSDDVNPDWSLTSQYGAQENENGIDDFSSSKQESFRDWQQQLGYSEEKVSQSEYNELLNGDNEWGNHNSAGDSWVDDWS